MKMKIDHIGIAVKDIEVSSALFSTILNRKPFSFERVESQKLSAVFFKMEDTSFELLEPISSDSPISKFLEKKGEGIHHVALIVDDIKAEMERLKNEGFNPLTQEPYVGANNKLVCFFHPKDTNGVLIELCQHQ
ncbi:MAG: methylmalonyl-CoA epimerase [Bacteroidetes bacterium]|nr:methylmalonyl-CoA epimerase [Bacteroidota bacterium]MBK7138241.1 methylmalonyl-CoA epimerase [Bacteroidota bacterium]MBK7641197.1 methylmalonyl-CoA epimerase [Bacteroidota bacterium]MBK8673680.1 methylmalonyl-CoA epimerase [Bacteroidota bacterium]MBK9354316.1 methylmalonyl-CoA epimerase [Bacteroidota bacterium]